MDKLRSMILGAEVISFDIFGTLLVRRYAKPEDRFLHLEASAGESGFSAARAAAERSLRQAEAQDPESRVTLEKIYGEMHPSYRGLMEREIALETRMCRADGNMQRVYREALAAGKRVVVSSDTCLPGSVVGELLRANGFEGYEAMLLTAEGDGLKASGALYANLIRQAGVAPGRILHIGTDQRLDYRLALDNGMQAYWYSPGTHTSGERKNAEYFESINRRGGGDVALSILQGLVAEREEKGDRPYWNGFGYKYMGIIAYGYARWLKAQFDAEGIERAYFVTRDGLAFKRVFEALYPEFDSREIHASRRLFLFACMGDYGDIRPVLTGQDMPGVTLEGFWDMLGVDDENLKRAYENRFPDRLRFVAEKRAEIDDFMQAFLPVLKSIGEAERKSLAAYYNSIGISDKKSAVVGLGWTGSLLQGIARVCAAEGVEADLKGYYLATHDCQGHEQRTASYMMDHGNTAGVADNALLRESRYAIDALKLAFSGYGNGVVKFERRDQAVVPVFARASFAGERNAAAQAEVLSGIMDFVGDIAKARDAQAFEITPQAVLAPIGYIARDVSKADEIGIGTGYRVRDFECVGYGTPILRQGKPSFGVINPWPGEMSAESEIVIRMKRTSDENGLNLVPLDNFAHVLDEKQKATGQFAESEDLNFVITTHYETPKILDAFAYHTVWNPPEIPLNAEYYTDRVTDQYVMNDDFLIYDTGGMTNHLRSVLMDKPRTLEGASLLIGTFPASAMLEPKLENPTMFYCGMNWESVNGSASRHGGLFKLLDKTNKVKFFGPEKVEAWGGIRPWEGYACYQYSIPFDGFSIVREINNCGICLVLSSDIHRRAGSETNRLYEACTAGAVIITDDNEFMLRYFRDAALFINYNKNDPEDTFRQLMEKYDWIVSHPEEALELARRAQRVYRQYFTLDAMLLKVVERHPVRFAQIKGDLFARDDSKTVLATFVLNTKNPAMIEDALKPVLANVRRQYYPNIELGIACDTTVFDALSDYCVRNCLFATPVAMRLFDGKGSRVLTDGQAIRRLQKMIPHDYFIMTNAAEIWFSDHVTTLVRSIEDSGSMCAYAGMFGEDHMRYRRVWMFGRIDYEKLYEHIGENCILRLPGAFLFSRQASEYVPDYLFDCLDGKEHFAYANLLHYRHNQPLVFSHRMTIGFRQEEKMEQFLVLDEKRQVRFVQDLVRYHLPEVPPAVTGTVVQNNVNISDRVTDMLINMPIKTLVKLRYHQAWMHKLPGNSKCREKHAQKHDALVNQLHDFWK